MSAPVARTPAAALPAPRDLFEEIPGVGRPRAGGILAGLRRPVRREPRGARWWIGVAGMALGLLLLAFLAHAMVLSGLQYQRAQILARGNLRTSLARATAPVGQLGADGNPVALGTPVALLEIPAIGLQETVLEGTDGSTLRGGPGLRRDSVTPGQAGLSVILGRQATYGGPFGRLSQLRPGDTIRVTTGQGVSVFRVASLRHGGESAPAALLAGAGRLELQTGDGLAFAPGGVLYVDAELVSPVRPASTRVLASPMLPVGEQAMGGDPSAWLKAGVLMVFLVEACAALGWAWGRWGRRSTWVVGVPVLLLLLTLIADSVMAALPNLL